MHKQIFRLDFSHARAELRERYLHRAPLYVVRGENEKDFDVIETSANAEQIWQRRHWVAQIRRKHWLSKDMRRTKSTNREIGWWARPLGFDEYSLYAQNVILKPVNADGEEGCQMIAGSIKTHASFWEIKSC